MSVPVDIDKYQGWLALDENELQEEHVPEHVIKRICRLRALYTYWCRFLSKSPKDLVDYNILQFRVAESQAYDDISILKIIVGNLQESSKKFWRWRINQMLEEDRKAAKRDGDHRAVASIEKNFIKNNQTDKEDTPDLAFDKIVPNQIEPTEDPSAAGVKKLPNLRSQVKKLLKQYDFDFSNAEYADFEELPAPPPNIVDE